METFAETIYWLTNYYLEWYRWAFHW